MPEAKAGDRRTIERTFTVEEVRAFAEISGDKGRHHLQTDPKGRLIVHGLLLASLPTQIGGEMNFLAQELVFEFLRPAWTGVRVTCEATVQRFEPVPKGHHLESTWECKDPEGRVLMRGHAKGLVPHGGSRIA